MKSGKSKIKNSTTGHNFVSVDSEGKFYLGFDPLLDNVGPNGPRTYEPAIMLPPGMNAACHICKPVKYFKTLEECRTHFKKEHY